VSAQRPFNRPTDFIFPSVKDIRDLALSACGIDDAAAAQDQIWYGHKVWRCHPATLSLLDQARKRNAVQSRIAGRPLC
jgi:hypothetical protein